MDCGSLSRSVQPEIARNEDVEARDTKGINLISMKPFLLTIVGPFQPPNPPYFQSLVCLQMGIQPESERKNDMERPVFLGTDPILYFPGSAFIQRCNTKVTWGQQS